MSVYDFSWLVIAGLGGLATFVYSVSHLAEDGVNNKSKKKLQNIVKNYKASPSFRHAFFSFTLASDAYFGERLWSYKSFLRSGMLSLSWLTIVTISCVVLLPKYRSWLFNEGVSSLVFGYGVVLIFFVIFLDFISVNFTRLVVRTHRPSSFLKLLMALALDLSVSVLIFYIGFSAVKYILVGSSWLGFQASIGMWINLDHLPIMLKALNSLTSEMLQRQPDGSFLIEGGFNTEIVYAFPEGVMFYSSLLTSIWLWLHILSYLLLKVSLAFDRRKKIILSHTNIEEKPFISLAVIFLFVCAVLTPVLIAVFSLMK